MKIGIISVNNAHNFGTCMQAYAFKEYLSSLGHEVFIINHRIPKIETSYKIYKKPLPMGKIAKLKWHYNFTKTVLQKPYYVLRHKRHEHFFNTYLNLTPRTESIKQLRNANYDFDIVFAGSDQIWNDEIVGNLNPAFFCDFVKDTAIRASYAASIGKDNIALEDHDLFSKFFEKMDYISVREENAKTCLEKLTDKKISVVLDPTLLPDKQVYIKLLKKCKFKGDYIYVHVHHYSAKGLELITAAKELSARTGLPIVHNLQNADFKNELGKTRSFGPEDILTTIVNAKYIVTQSFHVTVFSIIFGKTFFTLARDKFSDRLTNLLEIVGLQEHYIPYLETEKLPYLENVQLDTAKIQEKLKAYKDDSINYIASILNNKKPPQSPDYFSSFNKYNCYGCSLCHDICPTNAITMESDKEGFVFPRIDSDKCISCNKCRNLCIYNNTKQELFSPKAYFSYNTAPNERENSTSGGVFAALSNYILKQNGYVIGVKYDSNFQVVYDIAHTPEACEQFRFSKYVEPNHNNIYEKTKLALETGRPVLFTGSPCKIAGLKNYLNKDYANLYLVDIICECTSSPIAFQHYIKAKEKAQQSNLVSIKFRSKARGWANRATELQFDDGSTECVTARYNVYYHCFVSAYLAKYSCYNCHFCGDNKIADMTIGDFWNSKDVIDFPSDDKGYSAIKVGSAKGMQLLSMISDSLYLKEVQYKDIYNNNHSWPVDLPRERSIILNEILDNPDEIINIMKKYNPRYNKKRK